MVFTIKSIFAPFKRFTNGISKKGIKKGKNGKQARPDPKEIMNNL